MFVFALSVVRTPVAGIKLNTLCKLNLLLLSEPVSHVFKVYTSMCIYPCT